MRKASFEERNLWIGNDELDDGQLFSWDISSHRFWSIQRFVNYEK